MKKFIVKLNILCIICFVMIFCSISKVQAKENTNVLFISSYNPNFVTFNDQINGIKDGFDKKVELQIEYMDTKTFATKENETNFYNLLKYKISNYKNFDAIILGDDEALEFGMKYREELFKGIPMAFLGIQKQENKNKALKMDMVSGVSEIESMHENFALMVKLHPNVKNIYVINRDALISKEAFYNQINSKGGHIDIKEINTSQLSYEEIEEKVKSLNKDDILYCLYPKESKDEKDIDMSKIIALIDKTSGAPVYHVVDLVDEKNCVGGKIISHFDQGKYAAKIVKKMLNGYDPKSAFIDGSKINKYIFNYKRLKEYGIDEKELPEGSIIRNKPMPFFERYKMIILPASVIILSLNIIIVVLIIYGLKRNKYEMELLKAKEVAEEANKAKGNFMSNINHELRTPVSVIMTTNQLLNLKVDKFKCLSKEEFGKRSYIIRQNCYRLTRLINNIIDVTKSDSGFDELMLKNVNIVELLEQIVTSVIPYTERKGIKVIFDTDYEEVIIAVEPNKIERIMLNLLSNAIKFSDNNGVINVNVTKDEDRLIFSVRDTGIGIEEKYLDEIFMKFTQIDTTLKRMNEGGGVGLYVVKSFVELHEGKVNVESKLGVGSEFRVELPIKTIEENEFDGYIIDKKLTEFNANIELSDIYL